MFDLSCFSQAAQQFPDGFINGEAFQRLFNELDKDFMKEVCDHLYMWISLHYSVNPDSYRKSLFLNSTRSVKLVFES